MRLKRDTAPRQHPKKTKYAISAIVIMLGFSLICNINQQRHIQARDNEITWLNVELQKQKEDFTFKNLARETQVQQLQRAYIQLFKENIELREKVSRSLAEIRKLFDEEDKICAENREIRAKFVDYVGKADAAIEAQKEVVRLLTQLLKERGVEVTFEAAPNL